MTWTQEEAISLCQQIEQICPEYGCHVALTGGALYKDGPRKDLDILFYRIRQAPEIEIDDLFAGLEYALGIKRITDTAQWCIKAKFGERNMDCFFPEHSGEYPQGANTCEVEIDFQEIF